MRKPFTKFSRRRKGAYRKRRFTSRSRALVQRPSTTFQMPKQLYFPLPAQFKVALTAEALENWTIDEAADTRQRFQVQLFNPSTLGGVPSSFLALHQLYARSCVDSTVTTVTLSNTGPNYCHALMVQAPNVDTYNAGAGPITADQWNRFLSMPEVLQRTIGPATGGHDQLNMTLAVDHKKLLDAYDETSFCSFSTNAVPPAMTYPVYGAVGVVNPLALTWPSIAVVVYNPSAGDVTLFRRVKVTFHITFSQRHVAAVG